MTVSIIKGESVDLQIRFTDLRDLTGYSCQLQVRDSSDTLAGVNRSISTKNTAGNTFIAQITPAESGGMAVGTYTISAQLVNASTGHSKELNDTLTISKEYNY
jgi:hypothetical protein